MRYILFILIHLPQFGEFHAQSIIRFSHNRGFRTEGFDLVSEGPSQTVLRYTLNGKEPMHRYALYTVPIFSGQGTDIGIEPPSSCARC